jgi:hypothetical protein
MYLASPNSSRKRRPPIVVRKKAGKAAAPPAVHTRPVGLVWISPLTETTTPPQARHAFARALARSEAAGPRWNGSSAFRWETLAVSLGPTEAGMSKQLFDWRAHLKIHPAAELFPLLSEEELKALADDIEKNGLVTKLVLAEDGSLLDGRNRLDAAASLGLLTWERNEPRKLHLNGKLIEPIQCEAGEDPYALALSYNVHRRHLTAEQKRELIAKVLKAKPEQSNRAIAKQVKVDHKTVADVRTESEGRGEIPHVEKRTDSKGRKQPATKPKAVNPKDIALETFDAHILELLRISKGQKPQRFARTAVPQPLLGDLVHFLRELVSVRKLAAETPDASASAEKRKAAYASAETVRE